MRTGFFAGFMVIASASMSLAQSAPTTDLLIGQAGDEFMIGQAGAGGAAGGGGGAGGGAAGAGGAGAGGAGAGGAAAGGGAGAG
ncbi:MAG: hypothetical protein ABJ246_20245, partial [Paracoccaceae bacterium]